MKIKQIQARELLDSRGYPTVEASIILEDGTIASAMVPSGASTGAREALELRDKDDKRFLGKGVLKAVGNVNEKIAPELIGMDVNDQMSIDQKMLELDGTKNKENLGANAILAVSISTIKAAAESQHIPVYKYIYQLLNIGEQEQNKYVLPIPMMNVLNGGKHAIGSTDFQEFMIVPIGAPSLREAVRWGSEIFHHLGKIMLKNGWAITVGDEGGYVPPLKTNEQPFKLMLEAIESAGYKPGSEVSMAIDPAASEFYEEKKYNLKLENRKLSSDEMIDMYQSWINKYPIISIEDGFSEDDWDGFKKQTQKMGKKIQVVGDDLFVTNAEILKKGIENKTANSILIKLNQIGSVTETLKTIKAAFDAGMTAIVSHRSGETEDPFIADLAVGTGIGQIKTGSLSRSERICKYNQLMRIEEELGDKAQFAKFPFAK